MLDVEKAYRFLFDLIEEQEGVKITFTLKEKEKIKEEDESKN